MAKKTWANNEAEHQKAIRKWQVGAADDILRELRLHPSLSEDIRTVLTETYGRGAAVGTSIERPVIQAVLRDCGVEWHNAVLYEKQLVTMACADETKVVEEGFDNNKGCAVYVIKPRIKTGPGT